MIPHWLRQTCNIRQRSIKPIQTARRGSRRAVFASLDLAALNLSADALDAMSPRHLANKLAAETTMRMAGEGLTALGPPNRISEKVDVAKYKKTYYDSNDSNMPLSNSHPRNYQLEEAIHRCIASEKTIFTEGQLGENARRIVSKDGYYDVVSHGSTSTAVFYNESVTPEILSNILKSRRDYDGKKAIRLIACSTGKANDKGDCFAQRLSDLLGVEVEAPNDYVWVFPDGHMTIGSTPSANTGEMLHFYPKRGE